MVVVPLTVKLFFAEKLLREIFGNDETIIVDVVRKIRDGGSTTRNLWQLKEIYMGLERPEQAIIGCLDETSAKVYGTPYISLWDDATVNALKEMAKGMKQG